MSTRYVALLRAVNVGGKNRLPMADLAALAAEAGADAPRTFIQSGNLVFSLASDPAPFARALTTGIQARFGFVSPVIVRSAAEWADVIAGTPYTDESTLNVAFLADAPAPARVAALDPARSPGDAFTVRGREVYLHVPNGLARTKLTTDWLDRQLATVATVRNWRTVRALGELLGS